MAIKKLVLLHSNDLHGDYLPEIRDGVETGGLARLSGYVKRARQEEDNVIYANAGDMFRGSIIDSEYLGLSTIDLMNCLAPDVTTIGNHEVDYGIAHLLFLEKCAHFPIVNANLYVTMTNTRLFRPYLTVERDGVRIMFIGILTEEVLSSTKKEKIIGTLIDVEDAAKEVGIICDNYRTRETDMVVLLTHLGIEADRKLASMLDPNWGVDLIIGGHSHTCMEAPEIVNGVPIVQVGSGTDQVGRFEIEYDTFWQTIKSWSWGCVPITEKTAPLDRVMEALLGRYKGETDAKYQRVVTSFARKLTHPSRIQETELGNLYADLLQSDSSFDIMMLASGALRKPELGPVVEYQDMAEVMPFDEAVHMFKVTGAQFKRIVRHLFRDETWAGGHTEFYQFSKGVRLVYRKSTRELLECSFRGKPVEDGDELLLALMTYHFQNFDRFLGVPLEEVSKNMKPRIVATSAVNLVEEYFSTHQDLDARVEGRIVILE